jgi:hypothetical protein
LLGDNPNSGLNNPKLCLNNPKKNKINGIIEK